MQTDNAIKLSNFLFNNGFDVELYEGYSGRGMYGKSTTGVTTNASPYQISALKNEMEKENIDVVFRQDSMGLDFIYY